MQKIVVWGAQQQEGATTVALNLAKLAVDSGFTALFVDADVYAAKGSLAFEGRKHEGLDGLQVEIKSGEISKEQLLARLGSAEGGKLSYLTGALPRPATLTVDDRAAENLWQSLARVDADLLFMKVAPPDNYLSAYAITHADAVITVMRQSLGSLRALQGYWEELHFILRSDANTLVLNAAVRGGRPEPGDVDRILGRQPYTLLWDPEVLAAESGGRFAVTGASRPWVEALREVGRRYFEIKAPPRRKRFFGGGS